MNLYLLTNRNNKFGTAYHGETIEDVIAFLRPHYPGSGFRQIGANTWELGMPDPKTGLLQPVKYLFKHEPQFVPKQRALAIAA